MNIVSKGDKILLNQKLKNLFDKIVWLARKDLGIEKAKIHFVFDDNFLNDWNCNARGSMTYNDAGEYIIYLREEACGLGIIATILHELVHVSQYEHKILTFENEKHHWKGKCFDDELAYEFRPWEFDARKIESRAQEYANRARDL